MPEIIRYIDKDTAPFSVTKGGQTKTIELLWGDQVRIPGNLPVTGEVEAFARGSKGRVRVSDLGQTPLLEVYMIDVGQGDGILICTPDRRHILIDGGFRRRSQPSGKNAADFVDWKFKKDYGVDEIHLDAMIASHNDADHYGGLWDLLNPNETEQLDASSLRVDAFYHAGVGWWKRPPSTDRTLGDAVLVGGKRYLTSLLGDRAAMEASFASPALQPQGYWGEFLRCMLDAQPAIPVVKRLSHVDEYVPGFSPSDGPASIRVLAPVEFDLDGQAALRSLGSDSQNTNGNSVLLRVDFGSTRILLTGDLNAAAQQIILEQYADHADEFASDVVKACHHGSDDCSYAFLSAIKAAATVISSGDNETHAHPRPAILAASAISGQFEIRADKLVTPLVYSTEVSRSVRIGKVTGVRRGEALLTPADGDRIEYEEVSAGALNPKAGSRQFHGSYVVSGIVYGLVNVRTDGKTILCATLNEGESSWVVRKFESRF